MHHIEVLQARYHELRRRNNLNIDIQDLAYHTMLADATCVATIDHRRGRYQNAYTFFVRSMAIREKDPSTTAPELADAYSAIGLALFGLFQSCEVIVLVDKALAVAYAAPPELHHTFNIGRYLRNRSRPRAALRDFSGAKQDVEDADAFQTRIYGANSHFHGETAYILGKIAIEEGDLDEADRQLQRAYDLQYPGKPTHQSVASALYHQARAQKYTEQALLYLQQALSITQFNESRRGDQGESARVKRKIADIWERQGRLADAATYRAAALREKAELERTGLHPKAPDAEQEWDCFSDLKGDHAPAINQIEYHAYLQRVNGYVPWMREQGIHVASFKGLTPAFRAPEGPLRQKDDEGENVLDRIAGHHGTTAAVVLLAWLIQRQIVAVTMTTKPERLDEYAQALKVTLTPDEFDEITTVGATYHFRMAWGERFADDDRS
ncbi:hypothetical protein Sste5346_005945 [Sporothrix stenoceras]|uniref:NADP-dependent oxidoreductase domain-containing protein n=1 Tax=Sporothrix stenoceras TaxID=5173 RepID=A0ABR3Z0K3_9PEZI